MVRWSHRWWWGLHFWSLLNGAKRLQCIEAGNHLKCSEGDYGRRLRGKIGGVLWYEPIHIYPPVPTIKHYFSIVKGPALSSTYIITFVPSQKKWKEKILSCHNVGLGFDGLSYEYPQLDDDGKKIGVIVQDKPEGKICRRLAAWNKPPNYLYQLFMLYRRAGWGWSIRDRGGI